jgi:hypothetical protein
MVDLVMPFDQSRVSQIAQILALELQGELAFSRHPDLRHQPFA